MNQTETVNRRAWNDLIRAHGTIRYSYFIATAAVGATTALATIVVAVRNDWSTEGQIWTAFGSAVGSLLGWAFLLFIGFWLLAPIRQRNEARKLLVTNTVKPELSDIDKTLALLKNTPFNCGDSERTMLEVFEGLRVGLASTITQYQFNETISKICDLDSNLTLRNEAIAELVGELNIHDLVEFELFDPAPLSMSNVRPVIAPQAYYKYWLSDYGKKVALAMASRQRRKVRSPS